MNNTQADLGFNRTGVATSPLLSKEMVTGGNEFPPDGNGNGNEIAVAREEFVREAEPLGSVPPPLTAKGMLKSAGQALKGEAPTQFIDKLGERLAFERTGVRLYQALLSKYDALGSFDQGPTRGELEHILGEELAHFELLQDALTSLGADPTVMTPSADVHATITKGVLEIIVDPRTNLAQCLEAVLVAELADNECWATLTALAQNAGAKKLVTSFSRALKEEQQHLSIVRSYIAAAQGRQSEI